MNSFNSFEHGIARFLATFPLIKKLTKFLYVHVIYLLYKKRYLIRNIYPIQQISSYKETFFGYYDKMPISSDGSHILYHSSSHPTYLKPRSDIPIEIVLQDIRTNEIVLRIPSSTYNWQQGCRTQWLIDDLFMYNDFDTMHQRYIARVWSVNLLKEVKVFDYPVQDSYHTDYFLSLNYQRLMALRPDYGYRNLPVLDKAALMKTDDDGIWKIDYEIGKSDLLVSLSAVSMVHPAPEMDSAFHKVNHILISPSGKQFIFIHRYYIGQRRYDRLMLADSVTGQLKLLSEYGMVSHCFWADDKTILGYLRGPGKKDAYWLIDIERGNFTPVANGKLDHYGDGHPHVHGDWFVTDTYPDKARMQHLILVNWKTGEVKELGEFFHGFKYVGETRCDLHPRFSPDGRAIFFDSVFSGKRQLYKIVI
jgi:hypothetical protein